MSLIGFRDRFEEKIHGFLWRQWTALGVAGTAAGEDRWILDPEALLLFTLESARSEPRLFDEVLDWLLRNGALMDVQRLRNIQADNPDYPGALLRASALVVADQETSAKWSRLAAGPEPEGQRLEPLFLLHGKNAMPEPRTRDPHFARAGFLRTKFEPRKLSQSIPLLAVPALRFRLRTFFGIGIRAEVTAYLLTHEGGVNGDVIARAVGYSLPGVQEVLREMEESSLVRARREGREKRYWVERDRWWSFLGLSERAEADLEARRDQVDELAGNKDLLPMKGLGEEERRFVAREVILSLSPPVQWINWVRLFRGLAGVLRFLRTANLEKMSAYLQASEFSRIVSAATADLEGSELAVHVPRQERRSLDILVRELEEFLEKRIMEHLG